MLHAKNYETVSTFVKVMQKNRGLFFPDTVYQLHVTDNAVLFCCRVYIITLCVCSAPGPTNVSHMYVYQLYAVHISRGV